MFSGANLVRQAALRATIAGSKHFASIQIMSRASLHTLKPALFVNSNVHNNNNKNSLFQQQRRTLADASMTGKILDKARETIDDELKKQLNAVFIFKVSGKNYLLDAHASRPLKVELLEEDKVPEKVDVTLITDEDTFVKMAQGKTKPTSAFMTGKLKIKGNVGVAMKAEKIFKAAKVKID